MTIDRHHLLECILWPNGDGTFRKIINQYKRLEELGIYDDFKMTIPIEHRLHQVMHREFNKGTIYDQTGERGYMYGRRDDKHPRWKGGVAHIQVLYKRALKRYKAGDISEEEMQTYRDALSEFRRNKKATSSTP